MIEIPSHKYFQDSLQTVLDLLQLLKYNLEDFKELEAHKGIPKDKNMRPDCAALIQALNSFLFKMKGKCQPDTFAAILRVMNRDRLHDLSLHMRVAYDVENIVEITKIFLDDLAKSKKKHGTDPAV